MSELPDDDGRDGEPPEQSQSGGMAVPLEPDLGGLAPTATSEIAEKLRQEQGVPVGWKLPTLTAAIWVIALTVISAVVGVLIAGRLGV
jgi:hypothetical protein